jgi:hypothetical protein
MYLAIALGVLLLILKAVHFWRAIREGRKRLLQSMTPPLTPDATKVLFGLRDFHDPLAFPLPAEAVGQSLSELEAAGLITEADGQIHVTPAGRQWGIPQQNGTALPAALAAILLS